MQPRVLAVTRWTHTPVQLTDGYYLAPATGVTENITSVTGLPPVDIAVEGNQLFDVYDAATDQPVGAFEGVVTNTRTSRPTTPRKSSSPRTSRAP